MTTAHNTSSSFYFWWEEKGVHGYAPPLADMGAILYARSASSFHSGVAGQAGLVPSTSNLNVFNLLCHILRISPSPNNGTLVDFAPFMTLQQQQ